MRQPLAEPLTVAAIARHAGVAERTLIRHFNATIGTTPIKWLTAQRVLHARRLLETTALSVGQVAESCGLGGAANLRPHFQASAGVARCQHRRSSRVADKPTTTAVDYTWTWHMMIYC